MHKKILFIICICLFIGSIQAQTVYVSSNSTYTIDALNQPVGTAFSTDRSASPGYFTGNGTAAYTGADATHNINGYVRHIANAANQAYSFPVGTGTELRTLDISGTIPATATIATAWIAGDPTSTADPTNSNAMHSTSSVGTGIAKVSPVGQWDWVDVNSNAAGTTVKVSIPSMSTFSATANLRLVGWDGSKWIDLSGSATATGNTDGSTLSGTIPVNTTTIQALGIGSTALALPVSFGEITARLNSGILSVQFTTEMEKNNSHFDIEVSKDGQNFTKVTTISSQHKDGNSSQPTIYNAIINKNVAASYLSVGLLLFGALLLVAFNRKNKIIAMAMVLLAGVGFGVTSCNKAEKELAYDKNSNLFVRIAQVDKDGTVSYSKVVKVVAE